MKIIDNTPIKDFNEDWGNPDGTGMKEKSMEQVQEFIKKKIKKIEEESVSLKNDNDSFKNSVNNQMSEQTEEINSFKRSVSDQIENYKPVEIHGDVTNAADEEDLTSKDGLLKIKNRNNLNGKGFVILRQSKTRSGSKTILTQEHFSQENTIYEIRYDFDLGGNTIKIPSGCTLMFTGGSFDNGCLLGDNTAIVAGAYKIFRDGLMLHQCCFSYKSNSIEQNIELPWIDIPKRIVKYKQSTKKRNWILTNDSGIRCSNFEGNCQFKKIDSLDIEFNIDSEFLLNTNPDKFSKIDSSTSSVIDNNLNTLDVVNLSSHKNGSVLTIPRTSKWVFFTNNNADDDLNETYILPGTKVDLSERSIYCTSLNRAFIHPEASTWLDACKLEWFVGDSFYKSFEDFKVGGIPPQGKNLQRALDSSMDIESSIRGVIPCENTLYAEVRKKINLGSRYNITDDDAFASNAKYKVKFSIPSTVIHGLGNIDLFVQRTTLTFYGGLLTTCYADVHNKNLWVVDMDYLTSYSDINTSLLGKIPNKGYFTNAAFIANADKNGNGYTSFSKYNLYTKHTKYGIYAKQYGSSYINSSEINAYIFGYYEGVHIESSFGASIINITLQASPGIPIAEVDNYRNAYISTSRSTINIINWDFSEGKTNAEIQNPYKKILIEGNNIVVGNLTLGTATHIEPYTDNTVSRNKKVIVTRTMNTPLSLPLMENVFAGISSAQIDECYYRKISCSSAIDIANLNEKIDISNSNYTYENISTSQYVLENMFSVGSGFLSATALNSNQFVEAYLSLKDGFTLDRGTRFKKCAFDFGGYSNIFKYAKVVFFKNSTPYYRDIELTEGCSFAIFDLKENFISDVTACLIRLYGDRSDNWGVGKEIASTSLMPQIRGYSLHESCNYFYRKFQPITYASTGSRPSSNVAQGEMYFDSNLKKPIWWTGTAWVDASGSAV